MIGRETLLRIEEVVGRSTVASILVIGSAEDEAALRRGLPVQVVTRFTDNSITIHTPETVREEEVRYQQTLSFDLLVLVDEERQDSPCIGRCRMAYTVGGARLRRVGKWWRPHYDPLEIALGERLYGAPASVEGITRRWATERLGWMDLPAVVVGNGESRQGYDLVELCGSSVLFGCNAIHRHYKLLLHYLCAVDQRMVREIAERKYEGPVFTSVANFRKLRPDPTVRSFLDLHPFPTGPEERGTGSHAVAMAAFMGFGRVYLLGFDCGSRDGKSNNIYKDTPNYHPSSKPEPDYRYEVEFLNGLSHQHPKRFKQVGTDVLDMPTISWDQLLREIER